MDELLLLLNEKWRCSLTFGWVPITGDIAISDVEIFDSNIFEDIIEDVRDLIRDRLKVDWLFQICEDGNIKKVNIDDCGLCYDGLEYIYADSTLETILYFSHENSTTIGGKAILEYIHQRWPEYAQHFWRQPGMQ